MYYLMKKHHRITILPFLIITLFCVQLALPLADASLASRQLADHGFDEVIFACRQMGNDGHWYANFGYYVADISQKAYVAMGRLCKLNINTDEVVVLLDDPAGTIRDPQVHYDAQKILFSYRKGGTENFNLYEINVDGSDLTQLTHTSYDDIEPTYLPDGGIMFCSSRCKRWVNCWFTQVAILYRSDGDGGNIMQISANIEHDNTPWPLPDGRIIHQRWEYVDRSQVDFHHLWTTNPDGTGQMVYFGNQHSRTVILDAKPIPGTENEVVAIFSPDHGKKEHMGIPTIITPKTGPDEWGTSQSLHPQANFRDPYPLSRDCFLLAQGPKLVVMNGAGKVRELYRLPRRLIRAGVQCHEPRPLRSRPREHIIPSRVKPEEATGSLILADVYSGRNMEGVNRGDIKKLLVLETLPKPANYSGGMEPISLGGTFTLERVLGTIPVEPDGSAFMELPALRSLFFVALDENNDSVKRMQSFLTVMPGEISSCVGCHEQRTRAPGNPGRGALQATLRAPSKITPIADIPEVFDFPRDIQPILDKHCLKCHDYNKRKGGVILSGDHGPTYSHSYITLTRKKQFADGRNRNFSNLAPRTIGAVASPLMKKMAGSHHKVKASSHELDMMRYWIETGAAYPGTYASLGTGIISLAPWGGLSRDDKDWPEAVATTNAIERRCNTCHQNLRPLPGFISDPQRDLPPYLWRKRISYQHVFNLTRPAKSLMLLAPLSHKAGGYGICQSGKGKNKAAVFQDTSDPDYQTILALCRAGKRELGRIKRFDMEGFYPKDSYVREMKRYGILPVDLPEGVPIDCYDTDRRYWKSLWYQPQSQDSAQK
jgi:Hydrazine synthase alpha subunit middle domain